MRLILVIYKKIGQIPYGYMRCRVAFDFKLYQMQNCFERDDGIYSIIFASFEVDTLNDTGRIRQFSELDWPALYTL